MKPDHQEEKESSKLSGRKTDPATLLNLMSQTVHFPVVKTTLSLCEKPMKMSLKESEVLRDPKQSVL